MIRKSLKLFLIVFFFSLSNNVNAELVDNEAYTSDKKTGLDWLDLSQTKGLSYNYVLSQFKSGGEFEGWEFATREQINVFLSNAGYVVGLKPGGNLSAISSLLDMWGVISIRSSNELGDQSKFMYGVPYAIGLPKKNNLRVYVGSIAKSGVIGRERGLVLLNKVQTSISVNESNDKTGSALVRKSH